VPTLVLLRHGKSDWSGGEPDVRRPLAKRGRRQASEAGRWLTGALAPIDLAVVSPAERARATWQLVADELADPPAVRIEEQVYAASESELLEVVRHLPDSATKVALVGHNPGIEDLVEVMTGQRLPMPTAALAVLELPGPWSSAGSAPARIRASGRPPSEGRRG
jgi:phosphohistidine phosphatase